MSALNAYIDMFRTTKFYWKRILVAAAVVLAFIHVTCRVSAYACSCIGGGELFLTNRESDDNTVILPRDARGVLWWQGGDDRPKHSLPKNSFSVLLMSGARVRNLDFQLIEVKPNLFLIAPNGKLVPGNRYLFTFREDGQHPTTKNVEAIVENTAFATVSDQVQLWSSEPMRTHLKVASAGMCSTSADVVAQDIQISEPSAIERWRFALLFETVLDGKSSWRPRAHVCGDYPAGSSWRGHGIDTVFTECSAVAPKDRAGTNEGAHDVYMRVSVPGTELVAVTKNHSFNLNCTLPPK